MLSCNIGLLQHVVASILVPGSTLSVCTTRLGSNLGISVYSHANMSLNSLSNRKRSDFSSSDNFELIEMGLGFYGSMPKSISSNSSLAVTCVSSQMFLFGLYLEDENYWVLIYSNFSPHLQFVVLWDKDRWKWHFQIYYHRHVCYVDIIELLVAFFSHNNFKPYRAYDNLCTQFVVLWLWNLFTFYRWNPKIYDMLWNHIFFYE